jgi:glutamate-1-semialdehyde 2,1-aminomutase
MQHNKSIELFKEAKKYIPGGVNSPVRAFKSVGMDPIFISKGKGSKIYDVDGNEYIDYVGSWGPLILGHAHPDVTVALQKALEDGTSFGAPTELEIEMAKQVISAVPSIEEVRMVSSGTEATMSAIRVARGYTKRNKIIKFEGCYHGHADSLLVKAGSGVTTLGLPDSPGVTKGVAEDTINLSYNDLESIKKTISEQYENIACVIVEPVAGNMGVIPPKDGFLEGLRDITKKYGVVLIFDEVMTGFRVAFGGAQSLYGIDPDLTCLGKVIGGGLPVGAFGGKREIMQNVAPAGSIYQAGTLSGNPIAMTAGIATLKILSDSNIYNQLEQKSAMLNEGFKKNAKEIGIESYFTRVGSMSCMFFTDREVYDYRTAKTSDVEKYALYFRKMLENGVNLAPSQFEACFMSIAHNSGDIEKTITANRIAFQAVKEM